MVTKFDLSAFNGELFNSKKLLATTKNRTTHGKICRYVVRNKETFFVVIQLVWYILKQLFTSVPTVKVVDIYLAAIVNYLGVRQLLGRIIFSGKGNI